DAPVSGRGRITPRAAAGAARRPTRRLLLAVAAAAAPAGAPGDLGAVPRVVELERKAVVGVCRSRALRPGNRGGGSADGRGNRRAAGAHQYRAGGGGGMGRAVRGSSLSRWRRLDTGDPADVPG